MLRLHHLSFRLLRSCLSRPPMSATPTHRSWYATICDQPPFLRWRDITVTFTPTTAPYDMDHGPDTIPFLINLTFLENDFVAALNEPGMQMNVEFVLETEAKWNRWAGAFREEQERMARPMLYVYANIRYHW